MKRVFSFSIFLFLSFLSSAQVVFAPKGDWGLETWEIDDFTVGLPKDFAFSDRLTVPENHQYALSNPDNSIVFFYCYFPFGEDFSQEDRLIREAAEMGMEVTGHGDITMMKLDNTRYLSFCFTDKVAIGVTRFYPDEEVGICFFVLAPKADDDGETVVSIITSIRVKE